MARHRDRVVAEVKRIRRKISRRLMAAHRKGRLHEAVRELERKGDQLLREAVGSAAVERAKKRKRA